MAYVQPKFLFSSLRIVGSTNFLDADEYAALGVDSELVMSELAVRLNLFDAIIRAFRELGIECLGGSDYHDRSIVIEIEDEDVDKVVNLDIEFEAVEILDEADCRAYLIEYCDFAPRQVESSGIVWVDGFEIIDQDV